MKTPGQILLQEVDEVADLLESKVPDWMLKMVRNPATGNMVQVRSLPSSEWDKYRPKGHPEKAHVKELAKQHKLGNWTTRGKDLYNKDTKKKVSVGADSTQADILKAMGHGGESLDQKTNQELIDMVKPLARKLQTAINGSGGGWIEPRANYEFNGVIEFTFRNNKYFTPRPGEEDDDFPDFDGQDEVEKKAKDALGPEVLKYYDVSAEDDEKNYFRVMLYPKKGVLKK